MSQLVLVTGGAGFIGANFVLYWLACEGSPVVNFDALTYAGNLQNLEAVCRDQRHIFVHGDITDPLAIRQALSLHRPRAIVHFAAESHVDRSIHGPRQFIRTNIEGTFNLLEEARTYWRNLDTTAQAEFRFLHVSTDEVYGSLGPEDHPFTETTPYAPNSPYSASKASSDYLVRAYYHTYGFPVLTTNCSNNYGPYQFPEKLIPLMILNALKGKPLPIYGDGKNVRDWLYVTDHCEAIRRVLQHGRLGETYNVGGGNELSNLDVVHTICAILDELCPKPEPHASLITFVKDRPGHDRRYAIDATRLRRELGWTPKADFKTGILKTVQWYLRNTTWVENVTSGAYRDWLKLQYAVASQS